MKKNIISTSFLLLLLNFAYSQEKYLTTKGHIDFFSHTIAEDIKADNNQVLSVVNLEDKEIVIHVLMKSFLFENSLMQEHFNEDYVESDKFPKSKFTGQIIGFNPNGNAEQKVTLKGVLTLRGKNKEVEVPSILKFKDESLLVKGFFTIQVEDFDIKIPQSTINNIAKSIKVSFDIKHDKYEEENEY